MDDQKRRRADLKSAVEATLEIQRLIDRISKADDDKRLLGYARQIKALMCGDVRKPGDLP